MPVLPSFIHKGKRKFKVPTKYPFGARRPNAPALASTGIIDVLDHSTSQFAEGDEEFVSRGSLDFDNDEHRYHYEPLDLNISPEPLMSSFPSRFLKNSYIQPNNKTAPRIFNDGEEEDGDRLGSTSVDNDGLDMEDDDADELIAKLQGMDASSFLGVPSSPGSSPFVPTIDYNATSSRRKSLNKAKLAPIQIQTMGAYDTEQGTSLPHSQLSSPASSAVSGTTLARALISNTFVLSIDTRDSRKYRSGISTLTRTDSATLPMGDHPFLSSLRGRDGKMSGEGLPWSAGSEDIPPVPPMPSEAELLLLASKATSPHSGMYWRKNGDFRRHSSTGSLELMRSPEISAPVASSEIPITAVIDSVSASSVAASRRISRITVATSSTTSTSIHRDTQEDENATAAALPDSPRSLPINLNSVIEEAPKPLPPVPGSIHTFPSEEVSPRDVIDYYSAFSPDVHQKGFKPAFSPITEVSETSGISPMTSPFKIYSGRSSMVSSFRPSPLSPDYIARKDSQSQSDSDTQPPAHLPTRDTSYSSLASPVTNNRRYRYSTSFSFATSNMPVGSSIRETLKRRKRSGSAPNPIVVVQDPQDHDKYRVTMSPDGVFGPSMRDSTAQTFPETPYSPIWSPLGEATTSIAQPQNDGNAHFPRTPESSSLTSFGNVQTSPSQVMLMSRAATGARHSRQSSLTRIKDIPVSGDRVSQESEEKHDVNINDVRTSSSQVPDHSASLNGPRKDPAAAGSSSLSVRSYTSSNDRYGSPSPSRDATSKRSSITGSVNTVNSKHGEQHNRRQGSGSITDGEGTSNVGNIYLSISRNESHSSRLSPIEAQDSFDSFQTPSATQYVRPLLASDLSVTSSSSLHNPALSHAENAIESPPAYDTVFGDRLASDSRTPSTAGFDIPTYRHPLDTSESQGRESLIPGSLNNQRQRPRPRPRLPAGPRDRRDGRTASQSNRERNGSVSSVTSTVPSGVTRASGAPPLMHSPHFSVPSPKFKGITMDAAKWTFTSAELQAIVSRAIHQSAEALSIRLLHLDTLDNDIPEDLHRLESERRDIQDKYRSLSHHRNRLLDTLSNGSLSQTVESPGSALRIVEALRDVSTQLDRLAEDLHSVDEQLSCLNMLVQKHSGSALAMALRKLNKSFLEKLSELELVRHEVIQLEAERNEAIKQAEEAALKANIPSPPIQRRPSVRRFKAGLYSPSRPTSYHSNRASISSILTANLKSPPGQDEIPPVPPIPAHPIYTICSSSQSLIIYVLLTHQCGQPTYPLSTAGFTPGTPDTRALLEQEALYVDIEHHIGSRIRRSRSFATFLPANDPSRRPRSPVRRNGSLRASRRPASLPGDSRLSHAYKAMNADGDAMLLTLRMLSDAV
ncbi:hypothetical protein F5887DRAFT_1068316 [Amanita rubescens]|nr:hypothetical protein F5887DRAFT_1068316 [Amanita rubescens]